MKRRVSICLSSSVGMLMTSRHRNFPCFRMKMTRNLRKKVCWRLLLTRWSLMGCSKQHCSVSTFHILFKCSKTNCCPRPTARATADVREFDQEPQCGGATSHPSSGQPSGRDRPATSCGESTTADQRTCDSIAGSFLSALTCSEQQRLLISKSGILVSMEFGTTFSRICITECQWCLVKFFSFLSHFSIRTYLGPCRKARYGV